MLTETRWRTSKSDGPTLSARFVLSCAVSVPSYEFVSVDFDNVYEPESCSPCVIRRFAVTHRPL